MRSCQTGFHPLFFTTLVTCDMVRAVDASFALLTLGALPEPDPLGGVERWSRGAEYEETVTEGASSTDGRNGDVDQSGTCTETSTNGSIVYRVSTSLPMMRFGRGSC